MNPTDQIAAELDESLREIAIVDTGFSKDFSNRIQADIEKAYNTGLAQGYEKRASDEARLRAAHASGLSGSSGYGEEVEATPPAFKLTKLEHASEPTNQIAAEARNKICQFFVEALGEGIGIQTDPIDNIIQSAIEKARQEAYEAGYREGGFAASRVVDESPSMR